MSPIQTETPAMLPNDAQTAAWTSAASIAEWWSAPHQTRFRRSYDAELVASLRSPYVEFWPGSIQALKLRRIFEQHAKDQTASITIGALDVITSHLLADEKFDTVYVSGSSCSISDNTTQDFGADMADYPYDTVPNKVRQLFRSQVFHHRNEAIRGGQVDRLLPVIADGDTGHGNQTANMKLAKLFVEAGAAAIHVDDQVPGTKKFGAKTAGRVLVPVEQHISRLMAIKLQLDVMGSEMMLIHRTDAETAGYVTSSLSPVDRPYILGSTRQLESSLASALRNATSKAEVDRLEDEWIAQAGLMTLDEAVKLQHPDALKEFTARTRNLNVDDALRESQKMGLNVFWSCDQCRSREGWYRFRGGIQPAIDRAIACSKYADVLWTRTAATSRPDLEKFAIEVRAAVPGCWLAYNLAADVQGSDEEIKGFTGELARLGYVWQFLPLAGQTGTATGVSHVVRAIREEGVLGYMKTVTRPQKAHPVSVVEKAWQGGAVADLSVGAVSLW